MLAPKSKVYKLVGPILINVDLEEAKENVGKRLEFIEAEVHKVDATIGQFTTSLCIFYYIAFAVKKIFPSDVPQSLCMFFNIPYAFTWSFNSFLLSVYCYKLCLL